MRFLACSHTEKALVLVCAALLLAGCGDDDPAPPVPSTTTTTEVTPVRCTEADIAEVMTGVGGGGWGEGYAYVPDDRDDVAEQLAARCGDSVDIERGPPIRPVPGP